MDEDDYPTEELLEEIARWPVQDFDGLMLRLQSEWHYEDCFRPTECNAWLVSTGGWSGNETLLGALEEKDRGVWWAFYHYAWRRGGHHLFAPLSWSGSVRFEIVETAEEAPTC